MPTLPPEPAPPPPPQSGKRGGCGGFGAVLMVVVAVAVTVLTQGAASSWAASTFSLTQGGAAATAIGGAVAGAAGAVASQAVGMAIGQQDSFSWKGVALSAVGGAVTAGLGASTGLNTALQGQSPFVQGMVRGAIGSIATQGIGVVTGLQQSFSWKNVAASAIAQGTGAQVADWIGQAQYDNWGDKNLDLRNDWGNTAVRNIGSGLAAGMAGVVVRGGSIREQLPYIAQDVIASTIGNQIADSLKSEPDSRYALAKGKAPEIGLKAPSGLINSLGWNNNDNGAALNLNPAQGVDPTSGNGAARSGLAFQMLVDSGGLMTDGNASAAPRSNGIIRMDEIVVTAKRLPSTDPNSSSANRNWLTDPVTGKPSSFLSLSAQSNQRTAQQQVQNAQVADVLMRQRNLNDPTLARLEPWDGTVRGSPVDEYLKNARGGLDSVRGDNWHFQVAQGLPEAALNEVGGLVVGKLASLGTKLLGWGEQFGVNVVKLDPNVSYGILQTPKGLRPNVDTYVSQQAINDHAALFKDGVTRIQRLEPKGTIGVDETWVMPKALADTAIAQAGGDVAKLERLLGVEKGSWGTNPVRVDIPNPAGLRMSTGNEFGANRLWNPSGYTNGGLPEAVINPVKPGSYIVTPIKVK